MKETRIVKTIANPHGRVTVSVPAHRKNKPGKKHKSSAAKKRKPTAANPAYMITLGAASNPRGNNVKAKAKAKKNTAARPHSHAAKTKARSNPVKVITITKSRPKSNPSKNNPELFGRKVSGLDLLKALGGSWLGALVARGTNNVLTARTSLPAAARLAISAAAGGGLGLALQSWDRLAGQGTIYGAMLATVTTGVDQMIPVGILPMSGTPRPAANIGRVVDGKWSHPSNPVKAAFDEKRVQSIPAVTAPPAKAMGAIRGAFGRAF